MIKPLLSILAVAVTLIAFYPYVRGILAGRIKPHVFSWVIWALTTLVVFFAQLAAGGGIGAWPIGISGSITLGIAVLAWSKRADISITRTDWLFFIAALASLPLWFLTADPLWAVLVLTLVDLLGFGPTVRKIWYLPQTESPGFFSLFLLRNLLVVAALEDYSVATVLFPAAIAATCLLLIMLLFYRRRVLQSAAD